MTAGKANRDDSLGVAQFIGLILVRLIQQLLEYLQNDVRFHFVVARSEATKQSHGIRANYGSILHHKKIASSRARGVNRMVHAKGGSLAMTNYRGIIRKTMW